MAADYTVKRNGDFFAIVEIEGIDSFDTANWTTRCSMRDKTEPSNETWPKFVPQGSLDFATSVVAGQPKQVRIDATKAQTGQLVSTIHWSERYFPLLDFELTETATGDVYYTESQSVEVPEAQTY